MLKNKFLSILFCVSSGSNDENLGSDEHEIIDICNIIIDVNKRQTLDICQYYLRPILKPALSSECTTLTGYTIERIVEQKTIYLEDFLKELDKQLLKLNIHPSQVENEFTFVVDGPLHLRQALIPECTKKDLSLPFFFYEYFDLRREFKKYLSSTTTNSSSHNKFSTLVDIAKYFQIENTNNNGDDEKIYSLKQCRLIEKICHLMLKNGHVFDTPETISRELEHGICSIDDYIEENTIVRVRGLPWQCTDQDVEKFFAGLNIAEGGVALCLSTQGRRNGEALVRFTNEEQRNLALRRHKHHIGSRYIEVYRASGKDFLSVAGGSNAEAKTFLSRNGKVIIRMRGLPFDSVAKDVVEFFRNGENSCEILDDESGVLFVHYPDGRATGDAFVMMKSEEEACRALLKHKETMGTRYIELFRSTSAEVQQVFKRSQDPKFYQNSLLMKSDMSLSNSSMASVASSAAALALAAASTPTSSIGPQVNSGAIPLPLLPPEMLSGGGGTKRDCIRLRNLPLECGVEQILEFLGVHSQHILPHGVHMILNAQAQPSGESFIQFDGEQSVYNVCLHKNGKCMYFGGKKYYIEVIQCSGEEMNLVLMGILPSNLINTYASGTIAPAPLIPPPPSLHNYAFKSPKYSAKTSPTASTSLMRAASGSNSSSPSSYLMLSNPNQAASQFQLPAVPTSAQLTPNLIYPTLNHATNPNGPAQVRAASIGSATSSASSLMAAATGQFANTQPYGPIIWYYPTPPVSPTTSALFYHHSQQSPLLYQTSAPPPPPPPPLPTSVNANVAPTTTTTHPCILVVKNAPYNVTVADVMNFFNGYEIIPDSIQIQNSGLYDATTNAGSSADVFITLYNRSEAERALIERNHQKIAGNSIELFLSV